MALPPIGFLTAAPIRAAQAVERGRRRSKAEIKEDEAMNAVVQQFEPTYAATTPEEFASDATREALQKIKFGG